MPIPENQRSMSAVPWSYPSSSPPWKSQTHQLSPMVSNNSFFYRYRFNHSFDFRRIFEIVH